MPIHPSAPSKPYTGWVHKRRYQKKHQPSQFRRQGGLGKCWAKGMNLGNATNRGQRRVPPCIPGMREGKPSHPNGRPMPHDYDKVTQVCSRCGYKKGTGIERV